MSTSCAPYVRAAQGSSVRSCLGRCPYSTCGVLHLRCTHRPAPQVEQELLESGALDGIISLSPTGEPDLNRELGSALDRKEWVHICRDLSDLAGAKRVPHPTPTPTPNRRQEGS